MENKIGETICSLRKENKLTQQQLSKLLGVSIAAISKWETNIAHPDIELLPKIADIFHVSIDYLFHYHINPDNSRLYMMKQADTFFNQGDYFSAMSILSEAILRYPNDLNIKYNHAKITIYSAVTPPLNSEKEDLLINATKELREVIALSEDRKIIDESYYLIGMSCINLKKYEEALDTITFIQQSTHINTNLAILRIFLEQGDFHNAKKQFELNLYLSISNIYANSLWIDQLLPQDSNAAILFYEMAIHTFKAYSGHMANRFDVYCSLFYEKISMLYVKEKKWNKVAEALQNATNHAILFDQVKAEHDLPQFQMLTEQDIIWNPIHNQKQNLLNSLEENMNTVYLEIKNETWFQDILFSLK